MTKKKIGMLAIFPILLIFIGWVFLHQISPVYAGTVYDQDPAYVYLFSGLSILDGIPPTHIDHPGTPLQVLVAFVALVEWLIRRTIGFGSGGVIDSVLAQPELYIQSVSWVLLILNAWAVFYFGKRIFQATNNIKLAIFSQSAPLVFWVVAPRIVYLAPEALLIFASLSLLGLLAPFLLEADGNEDRRSEKVVLLAGAVCGFGITVKITFIPMLVLLLLLGGRGRVMRAFVYAAISCAICISPVMVRLPYIWNWIYALTVHSGKYGAGESNILDVGAIGGRMVDLYTEFHFFYLVFLILALVLFCKVILKAMNVVRFSSLAYTNTPSRKSAGVFQVNKDVKTPLIILIVGGVQTLLVIKHPGPHYMVPVLPLAFMGVVWLVRQRWKPMSPVRSNPWVAHVLFALAFVMTINSTFVAYSALRNGRQIQDRSLAGIENILRKYSNPLVVGTYRCTLPECGLSFGAVYSPQLDGKVDPFLKNFILYNIFEKKLHIHGENVDVNRINNYLAGGRDVFLVSPDYPALDVFTLKLILKTPVQSLYKVTGLSENKS